MWGAYSKGDFSSWDKTAAEKLHLRFCKLFLGVNSKSSNDACRAELGRLPMKLIVDKQIMKYYQHLNELKHDAIAKQALEISKSLRAANKKCFMSYYERLVQTYNNNNLICSKSDINKAYNKMRINYLSYWKSKVEHSMKLEFFRSQNATYSQAKYLPSVRQFKI